MTANNRTDGSDAIAPSGAEAPPAPNVEAVRTLINTLQHELRTPAATIVGYADFAGQSIPGGHSGAALIADLVDLTTQLQRKIEDVIERFVFTADFCKRAGFTGVQFHAAHGYLLSQFLSPKTNIRNDQWGGSVENRARILFEIVERTRKKVGNNFPISVKECTNLTCNINTCSITSMDAKHLSLQVHRH